jgi:hypothetical protein
MKLYLGFGNRTFCEEWNHIDAISYSNKEIDRNDGTKFK